MYIVHAKAHEIVMLQEQENSYSRVTVIASEVVHMVLYGVFEPVSSQFRWLSVVFPKVMSSVPLWWEKMVQAVPRLQHCLEKSHAQALPPLVEPEQT